MKTLLKIMLVLAAIFASTFLLAQATGLLTIDKIEGWLGAAKTLSPLYVGGIVVALLFADLFIAVPTLTVTILAGFFLGAVWGAVVAISGLMMAGLCGYTLSSIYGERLVKHLIRDEDQRQDARSAIQQHGFFMILLARAMPILPEVTSCLAGLTRMRFLTFVAALALNTIPYAIIAAYAGSVSSLNDPKPALFTAIGLTAFFWISWFVYKRRTKTRL